MGETMKLNDVLSNWMTREEDIACIREILDTLMSGNVPDNELCIVGRYGKSTCIRLLRTIAEGQGQRITHTFTEHFEFLSISDGTHVINIYALLDEKYTEQLHDDVEIVHFDKLKYGDIHAEYFTEIMQLIGQLV